MPCEHEEHWEIEIRLEENTLVFTCEKCAATWEQVIL